MRVGNDPGLVADGVEDVLGAESAGMRARRSPSRPSHSTHLHAALAEELVAWAERDLDHRTELGELLGRVGLNVGDALEVGWGVSERLAAPDRRFGMAWRAALSHSQMSILTICFHAVKRSMRMSDGLSS